MRHEGAAGCLHAHSAVCFAFTPYCCRTCSVMRPLSTKHSHGTRRPSLVWKYVPLPDSYVYGPAPPLSPIGPALCLKSCITMPGEERLGLSCVRRELRACSHAHTAVCFAFTPSCCRTCSMGRPLSTKRSYGTRTPSLVWKYVALPDAYSCAAFPFPRHMFDCWFHLPCTAGSMMGRGGLLMRRELRALFASPLRRAPALAPYCCRTCSMARLLSMATSPDGKRAPSQL